MEMEENQPDNSKLITDDVTVGNPNPLQPDLKAVNVKDPKHKQKHRRSESNSSDDSLLMFIGKEAKKEKDEGNRPKNTGFKISVSNLPGSMTEEDFFSYFGELPPYNYFFYNSGVNCGDMPPYSVAIINFVNKDDVAEWVEQLHGIVIVDQREQEFEVECDIMLNQGLPKLPVVTRDPLRGTVYDTDEFLEIEDLYDDTDGVFSDPPIPLEVLQDIMIREIDEKKAALVDVQETPLSKFLQEKKDEEEREKSRRREEAAEALRKASKEKRKQQERHEREKEGKDRRRERLGKEKLQRKEVTRKSRKSLKQTKEENKSKKQMSLSSKTDTTGTPSHSDGTHAAAEPIIQMTGDVEGPPVPRNPSASQSSHPAESNRKNEKIKEGGLSTSTSGRQQDRERRNEGRHKSDKSSERQSKPRKWEREPDNNWRVSKGEKHKGSSVSTEEKNSSTPEKRTVVDGSGEKLLKSADIEIPSTSTATCHPASEARKEPKKKIVKKIVRVKKLKNGETVTVAESATDTTPSTSTKPKMSTNTTTKISNFEKPSSSMIGDGTGEISKPNVTKEKSKRSRPDREVYRPGAWRRNSATDRGQTQPSKNSEQNSAGDRVQSQSQASAQDSENSKTASASAASTAKGDS